MRVTAVEGAEESLVWDIQQYFLLAFGNIKIENVDVEESIVNLSVDRSLQ